MTIGNVYEAKIDPKWGEYLFFVQDDDSIHQQREYAGVYSTNQIDDDGNPTFVYGYSRFLFEFVSGTPTEKQLWEYCDKVGYDGCDEECYDEIRKQWYENH